MFTPTYVPIFMYERVMLEVVTNPSDWHWRVGEGVAVYEEDQSILDEIKNQGLFVQGMIAPTRFRKATNDTEIIGRCLMKFPPPHTAQLVVVLLPGVYLLHRGLDAPIYNPNLFHTVRQMTKDQTLIEEELPEPDVIYVDS